MKDIRIEKLAQLLVNYSVAVRKGDKVKIRGDCRLRRWSKIYAEVLKAGGHPVVFLELEGLAEIFYKYASDEQLKFIHEPEKILPINMMLPSVWVAFQYQALSKVDLHAGHSSSVQD